MENPPKYLDAKSFKKELKNIFEYDAELMQKLSENPLKQGIKDAEEKKLYNLGDEEM